MDGWKQGWIDARINKSNVCERKKLQISNESINLINNLDVAGKDLISCFSFTIATSCSASHASAPLPLPSDV